MNKVIHIHCHTTDEPKHAPKGSSNGGQFVSGSGGSSGGSKPAGKSNTPAFPVKHSNRGASALAQMQAQSNKHLVQTGKGHVVAGKAAVRAEAEKLSSANKPSAKPPSGSHQGPVGNKHVTINHGGRIYSATGKKGTHLTTGNESHEYMSGPGNGHSGESRLWHQPKTGHYQLDN